MKPVLPQERGAGKERRLLVPVLDSKQTFISNFYFALIIQQMNLYFL